MGLCPCQIRCRVFLYVGELIVALVCQRLSFADITAFILRNFLPMHIICRLTVQKPPSRRDASRLAHAHAGGLDAERGLRRKAATYATPCHDKVGNFLGHQSTIGDLIILALLEFLAEVQLYIVNIDGIRRAADRIREVMPFPIILGGKIVFAPYAPGLARSEHTSLTADVSLFKAGNIGNEETCDTVHHAAAKQDGLAP